MRYLQTTRVMDSDWFGQPPSYQEMPMAFFEDFVAWHLGYCFGRVSSYVGGMNV